MSAMKIKVLAEYDKKTKHAGQKAKRDIEVILADKMGAEIYTFYSAKGRNAVGRILNKVKRNLFPIFRIGGGGTLLVQYPYSNIGLIYKKFRRKIIFIHDLPGLQKSNEKDRRDELALLREFDVIIVHNERMKKYLTDNGIKKRIVVLGVFDYLVKKIGRRKKNFDPGSVSVIYAGSLKKEKSPFIYQLDEDKMNFRLNLFGIGLDKDLGKKRKYFGAFSSDDLSALEGDVGLVWDGNYDESDEEVGFKRYQKYNNPHKMSLYLVSGMPVIVWRKAATAEFVEKNNVGYVIDSVYDINKLDFEDYEEKRKNAEEIGKRLRSGYYTMRAINEALEHGEE